MPHRHACLMYRFGPDQPMWISPVRDLTSKDLAMVSHYKGFKSVPAAVIPSYNSQPSLNALAEQLIATLSIGMPSTVHAIVGTACKLVVSHEMHESAIPMPAYMTFSSLLPSASEIAGPAFLSCEFSNCSLIYFACLQISSQKHLVWTSCSHFPVSQLGHQV